MTQMRLRELDVLRAIAVLLVLGPHLDPPGPDVATPLRILAGTWHRTGWVGVDLFFVLSGFLVSGLLFTEWQRDGRMLPLRSTCLALPTSRFRIAQTLWLGQFEGEAIERDRLIEIAYADYYFRYSCDFASGGLAFQRRPDQHGGEWEISLWLHAKR